MRQYSPKRFLTLLISSGICASVSGTLIANSLSIQSSDAKPHVTGNRSIYMNGVDVSSSRNQDMRNVHVKIDEYGNIFITAPHYQVSEEDTFTPLSSYKYAPAQPAHVPPQELPPMVSKSLDSRPQAGDSALAAPVPVVPTPRATETPRANSPDQPAAVKAPR